MLCTKFGLLTEPSLFDFLHENLITNKIQDSNENTGAKPSTI